MRGLIPHRPILVPHRSGTRDLTVTLNERERRLIARALELSADIGSSLELDVAEHHRLVRVLLDGLEK